MNEKKFILGIVLATVSLLAGGLMLVISASKEVAVEAAEGAKITVENDTVDWGEIKIDNGLAVANFELKNSGSETLKLFSGTTSCACTKAKVVTNDDSSGYFGMHSKSKEVIEIKPGESAQLVAEFDPAYHGPTGIGPINRQVTMSTNDPDNPEVKVFMLGNVVK